MFGWLEKRLRPDEETRRIQGFAQDIYGSIVAQARQPAFYRDHGINDTIPGRFEMIAMHMFVVLDNLRDKGDEAHAVAQQLVDVMFSDMDDVARELGIGDMGVGPKIKKLERSFRSRLEAYRQAFEPETDQGEDLPGQLLVILFGDDLENAANAEWFAAYMTRRHAALASASAPEMAERAPLFAPPE